MTMNPSDPPLIPQIWIETMTMEDGTVWTGQTLKDAHTADVRKRGSFNDQLVRLTHEYNAPRLKRTFWQAVKHFFKNY